MFKVNNKGTRTYFTPFSTVSFVGFQQLNVCEIKEFWPLTLQWQNNIIFC